MKVVFKVLLGLFGLVLAIYVAICAFFYFSQDEIIFPATRLPANYQFDYPYPFKEYAIKNGSDTLSGLLFTTDKPKGLVFYLHGNGGTLQTWGSVAPTYTALGYNVFVLDYPGYGKSTGHITNEQQMLSAVQMAYDTVSADYTHTVIIGFSIGTGPAAWLSTVRDAKSLILLAPYYNIADMVDQRYPFLPHFLAKYSFTNDKYIRQVKAPVTIFHGDDDWVIYHGASVKLSDHFKPRDRFITLHGQGHDNIEHNENYIKELKNILK